MEETSFIDSLSDELKAKIALLPNSPGVYKMFDASGTVIYVGKAKVLKNRVRQYFRAHSDSDPYESKVRAMVSHIADFEYIVTRNETEAFTLEANLIRQYMPKYNILLKDDKHFPYLRIDVKKDFPSVTVVRKVLKDGAKYFGPYLSAANINEAISAIRQHFPIRHCKKDLNKAIARRERPCLMYHIGKCCAPCSGKITREEYHALTDRIEKFLNGDTAEITVELRDRMMKASDDMDFETAAVLRDRIKAIESLAEKQRASSARTDNKQDVFAVAQADGDSLVFVLFFRDGRVVGNQSYMLEGHAEPSVELLDAFVKQFYAQDVEIPREILFSDMPPDADAISAWFRELSGHAVMLTCPKRGEKHALADLALSNAKAELARQRELRRRAWERGEGALTELSVAIGMDEIPTRIECYDNSHIQGRDMVGGMIVFTDGKPDNKEYRRFRIKAQEGGDDCLAMEEVLTRRFERAKCGDEKFTHLPDLIIVDGGVAQLNVCLRVLEKYGLTHIPAVGLAEKNEEIILPLTPESVILDKHSAPLHLIQRVRDEAHRFAITYHRSLRSKTALYSVLDTIDGVGDKRKRALFDLFVTIDKIKAATVEELQKAEGMNRPAAEKVYAFFHDNGQNNQ